MKVWKLETTVDSDDEYDAAKVLSQIDRDANRGDGIHIRVLQGFTNRPLKSRIRLLRKVKDDDQ